LHKRPAARHGGLSKENVVLVALLPETELVPEVIIQTRRVPRCAGD